MGSHLDLLEISNLIGEIDGDGESSTFPTEHNDFVTVAKLDLLRKQLEENQSKEIKKLWTAFAGEMKTRKENEKKLTKCIEKLMDEMVKLNVKITSTENRIEAIENAESPPIRWSYKAMPSSSGFPSGNEMQPIKIDISENDSQISTSPAQPDLESVSSSLPADPPRKEMSNRRKRPCERANKTTKKVKSSMEIRLERHEKSVLPGRYLPLMCVCGLEFDSDSSLSEHFRKQFANTPPLLSAHSKPHNDTPKPTTSKSCNVPAPPNTPRVPIIPGTSPSKSKSTRNDSKNKEIRHAKDPIIEGRCLCGLEFPNYSYLHRHIRYKTVMNFRCEFCEKEFTFHSHLKRHVERAHRKFKRTGSIVSKSKVGRKKKAVSNRWKVTHNHRLNGKKISTFGKQTAEGSPLEGFSHSNDEYMGPATSTSCYVQDQQHGISISKSSTSEGASKPRKQKSKTGKIHEADPGRPLYCLCGNKYRNDMALYHHLKYHTEYKKNAKPCKFCRRKFPYASQLTRHMRIMHQVGVDDENDGLD